MDVDVAYNQHSPHIKKKNRSSTNLNSLSLAPLTSRLPMDDADEAPIATYTPRSRSPASHTYMQSKSVPPTPGVLSQSRSASRRRRPKDLHLTILDDPNGEHDNLTSGFKKSKSSTQLALKAHRSQQSGEHFNVRKHKSGASTPGHGPRQRNGASEDFALNFFAGKHKVEDDWLLRTGSLMTTSAQESKGQTWLVSRASSTSLMALAPRDDSSDDDDAPRYAQHSANNSRRGSGDLDGDSPVTPRFTLNHRSGVSSRWASRPGSKAASRVQSRRGSRVGLTPGVLVEREDYFELQRVASGGAALDSDSEDEDDERASLDENEVRRLAANGTLGLGTWMEKLMGWTLFAVDEVEETDVERATETEGEDSEMEKEKQRERWREILEQKESERVELPPPPREGSSTWGDAAWLLSVASKVLL